MKRTAATSNSSEKSPNKRQKKNQRPGDEATTSNVTAASTEAASSDQQVGLQQQINAKIEKILNDGKDNLVQAKADALIYQNRCLGKMAKSGEVKIVENLIEVEDIDVNTRNKEGQTPLILASRSGHTEIVSMLLRLPETKVDAQDVQGFTALLYAAIDYKVAALRLQIAKAEDEFLSARKAWRR